MQEFVMQPTRRVRSAVLFSILSSTLVSTLGMVGCASQSKSQMPPPADEESLRLIRQSMTAVDPNTIVGLVIAVLPQKQFVAVGDVDVKQFQEGEPITFMDSNKKFIANGLVKHITADALDVQYEMPTPMSATPKVGDLAVRFKP